MTADSKAISSVPIGDPKRFVREFLAASAVCGLFLGWVFHAPLLSGGVAFGLPAVEALKYVPEPQYQSFSAYTVFSQLLRRGTFPAWTPHAQGGTPLIGKMGPGFFSPFSLPHYLFPSNRPHFAAAASAALKFYFAFAFLYLFTRLIGVGWFGSVFSALSFASADHFQIFVAFGLPASALCVPLLLLLSELYFQGRRRLSLLLLPWASALSFLGGHFEVAFLANFMAAIYFLARLWGEPSPSSRSKSRDLAAFAGAMLGGAGICGFYLLAGGEYVRNSYTTVWRTVPSYGWHYNIIAKRLTQDDVTVAFWGMAAAALALWFIKRLPKVWREGSWGARFGCGILTAGALGAALAFLANLGFDLSFGAVAAHTTDGGLIFWTADILFLLLAVWGWGTAESPPLRILGWFMLTLLVVRLKLPLLTNGLVQLPFFKEFNNNDYHFAFNAAEGVLGGAALDRLGLLFGQERVQRRGAAGLAFGFIVVFLAAIAAARFLEGPVARNFPTGLNPLYHAGNLPPGGIMGPERVSTYARSRTMTGWISSDLPASSISVGWLENGQFVPGAEAKLPRTCSSGRCYFSAELPLSERHTGQAVAALVTYVSGQQRPLYGPIVNVLRRGPGRWGEAVLTGIIVLFVLVFCLPPRFLAVLCLGMTAVWCWPTAMPASPAGEASYSLPGTDEIKKDPGLFRVSGFTIEFLHADFLNMYGLSDFRTGGDNLDVYSMIEFSRLCYNFLLRREDAKAMDLGLRLLGLANVRYLLSAAGDSVEHPGLQTVYQGQDMRVYRNKQVMPRAVYFDRQIYVPMKVKDLSNRDVEGRILGGIANELMQGKLDPARTLVLHDLPVASARAATSAPVSAASVNIREYEADRVRIDVDAPHPGFVFLSDNYFPGWRALVNGKPAGILRSWITFRAVEVPGGKSTVEFRYRPVFMGLPLLLSVVSCVVWVLLFLRYRGEPVESPAAARKLPSGGARKLSAAAPVIFRAYAVEECALVARCLCLGLIVPLLLFWLGWAGFVYRGAGINWAARLLLVGGAALLGMIGLNRNDAKQPD